MAKPEQVQPPIGLLDLCGPASLTSNDTRAV